jgi:hypothetical protein
MNIVLGLKFETNTAQTYVTIYANWHQYHHVFFFINILLITVKTPISAHLCFISYQRKWEYRKIVNETTVVQSAKWWENLTDELEGFSKW